jgi:hypothetical protein
VEIPTKMFINQEKSKAEDFPTSLFSSNDYSALLERACKLPLDSHMRSALPGGRLAATQFVLNVETSASGT